jgi:hypothetical protein
MTKYVNTILKVAVHRESENPVFGEGNTFVSVEDDAAGPFIVIEQNDSYNTDKTLRMEYEELLAVTEAAKMLMHQLYVEAATMESNSIIQIQDTEPEYFEDYQI